MLLTTNMLTLLKEIKLGKWGSNIRKGDIENYCDLEFLIERNFLKATYFPQYSNPGYFDIELTSSGINAINAPNLQEDAATVSKLSKWEMFERFMKTTKWFGWLVVTILAFIGISVI